MKNLHKRWFDNMKDYMERKQRRIEKTKMADGESPSNTEEPCILEEIPCKKQRVEC